MRLDIVAIATIGAMLTAGAASADLVRLKNGGDVRGEIDPATRPNSPTVVIETLGGLVLTFDREDVEFVTRRRRIVEEYETRAAKTPDDVESQWQLVEWCRDNALLPQRDRHLERVVALDPEHEDARRALRHVKVDGRWMTRDESMRKQGYVKYRNRYVTPQELELIEKTAAERAAEREWYATIRRLRYGLTHRSEQRRRESLAELNGVSDPRAVPALVREFADEADARLRMLLVKVLERIPAPASVGPLVKRSLEDADYEIRYAALGAIPQNAASIAVPLFVHALKHDSNEIVKRAAGALGRFGGADVVPELIDALVTTHKYRVPVKSTSGTLGFRSDGAFAAPNNGTLSVPPEVMRLMQAGQFPNGVIVNKPQQPNPHARVKWVTVRYDHQNADVRSALAKITGRDFGFDERTWRLWWASQKTVGG